MGRKTLGFPSSTTITTTEEIRFTAKTTSTMFSMEAFPRTTTVLTCTSGTVLAACKKQPLQQELLAWLRRREMPLQELLKRLNLRRRAMPLQELLRRHNLRRIEMPLQELLRRHNFPRREPPRLLSPSSLPLPLSTSPRSLPSVPSSSPSLLPKWSIRQLILAMLLPSGSTSP